MSSLSGGKRMVKRNNLKKVMSVCLCTVLTMSLAVNTPMAGEITDESISVFDHDRDTMAESDIADTGYENNNADSTESSTLPDSAESNDTTDNTSSVSTDSVPEEIFSSDPAQMESPDDLFIAGEEWSDDDLSDETFMSPASALSDTLSGNCGENGDPVFWELKDGVLTISGSGAIMASYVIKDWYTGEINESQFAPWKDYQDDIREVIIKKGVTKINSNAFIDCHNLEKVTIAGSVKKICYDAFANNFKLKDITIKEGVEEMENNVFHGSKITSINIPSSIKKISADTFWGLDNLQNIYIKGKKTYQSIDGVLFSSDGKTLVAFPMGREGNYTIPDSVIKIAKCAFSGSSLTNVKIPDSVTEIEKAAFIQCERLISLKFPPKLKIIAEDMCYNSTSLASVTIPNGVKEIQSWAFQGCTSLMSVTLPKTVIYVNNAFSQNTTVNSKNSNLIQQSDGTFLDLVNINIRTKDYYSKAFQVLSLVNKEREKAGKKALIMDQGLLETAMLRAAETVLLFDHTRPSGSVCYTANINMYGENIAYGSSTASGVMEQWMNSPLHKDNILDGQFTTIGIGCVKYNGTFYWVQCFGSENGAAVSASSYSDKTVDHSVGVRKDPAYYKASFSLSASKLKAGQSASVLVKWNGMPLKKSGVTITSSDPSVCSVQSDGTIKAVKNGTALITVCFDTWPQNTLKKTVVVSSGKTITITYDANGGKVSKKSSPAVCGALFGKLPTPTRKGYIFKGWYTAKKGGSNVTSSTKVTQTKNITLYAHWKKDTQ